MRLFDSHCHLHFPQFDSDRDEVLARMREKGIGAVVVGTDIETSRAALELAKRYDFLWASVGLHPNEKHSKLPYVDELAGLAEHPKVVAIGECGLDYFRGGGTPDERAVQKERLLRQISLAQKTGRAVIIHCRDAHEDMLALLAEEKPTVPLVLHFFTGTGALAQRYVDLGCYISFPGPVTYTDEYDDAIRVCPLGKVLVETDAPFAAPVPYRGRRNEPAYVEGVAKKVAQIKDISPGQIEEITTINARAAFSLPD